MERILLGDNNSDSDSVTCLDLSKDGTHVACGSWSYEDKATIIIYSMETGKIEYRADNVFPGGVTDLKFLPNSGLVSVGNTYSRCNLKVFSPFLELVQTLADHNCCAFCVIVSPGGHHIVSGDGDGEVMIWSDDDDDVSGEGGKWARVQVLDDHSHVICALCFSPDGKQLATGSKDKSVKVYSFNDGNGNAILAHTLEGHTNYIWHLSFSPDSTTLCSGSWDKSVKFWNPADGSLVKSIDQAHSNRINCVSYSPNGRVLVSAGYDTTMKIWDAETFELKHTMEQEYNTNQLTITADSNFIVSANEDHTVRITPCREYHLTCLNDILNLLLHIVYKWEFVSFPTHTDNASGYAHTIRLLGECVHNGGYNVASEILSFLSPAHLPVQITPTRWKSKINKYNSM